MTQNKILKTRRILKIREVLLGNKLLRTNKLQKETKRTKGNKIPCNLINKIKVKIKFSSKLDLVDRTIA